MLETTRLGIEVKNLKMRVESMSSRLDFDERRARALEGVVQYRPGAVPPLQPPAGAPNGGDQRGRAGRRKPRAPSGGARRRGAGGRRRPDQRGPGRQRDGPGGPDAAATIRRRRAGGRASNQPDAAADDPHES